MNGTSAGPARGTLGSCFFWGAVWGMLAWQIYAVVEYAAATIAPLLRYSDSVIASWHWKSSLILFAFYTLVGIITGGLSGILISVCRGADAKTDHQVFKAAATLTFVLAFIANLGATRPPNTGTILVGSFLALFLALCLISQSWRTSQWLLVNPWAAVLFLLAVAYMNYEELDSRPVIRFAVDGVVLCVLAGISHITRGIRRRNSGGGRVVSYAVGVAVGILAVLGCAAVFNRDVKYRELGNTPKAADGSMPNVVLITMDTVRADHLSVYGYNRRTTPNLEQLAQTASVFENAMAGGDMTLTSHSAIFTGVYASWNGARPYYKSVAPEPFSDKYPTLAEILSKHGYFTEGVGANFLYLSPSLGFHHGFHVYDMRHPIPIDPGRKYYLRAGFRRVLNRYTCIADFDRDVRLGEDINATALRLLEENGVNRHPFFLFLNYMDAHEPYLPPAPFDSYYPGRDCYISSHGDYFQKLGLQLKAGKTEMPQAVREAYISQYDGGIAYIDDQIGKLILRLKQSGMYENTLFIVTSDHGESFGSRNYLGHGFSVYHDEVHVPLIVKYPRVSQHRVVTETVGHTDILPTILGVAGIAPLDFIQGRALQGPSGAAGGNPISEAFPFGLNETHRAIYSDKFKFITSPGGGELYDLSSDAPEQRDLCSVQRERCASMRRALEQWVSAVPQTARPARHLDSQSLERLKSLGYVQ